MQLPCSDLFFDTYICSSYVNLLLFDILHARIKVRIFTVYLSPWIQVKSVMGLRLDEGPGAAMVDVNRWRRRNTFTGYKACLPCLVIAPGYILNNESRGPFTKTVRLFFLIPAWISNKITYLFPNFKSGQNTCIFKPFLPCVFNKMSGYRRFELFHEVKMTPKEENQ